MTAGFGFCKRSVVGALTVGLALSASAYGQDFRWLGVPNGGGTGQIGSTDSSCSVAGDTITCPGGGVEVQFDLFAAGWDDGTGRQLGAFQATVDPTSYDNGNAVLVPVDFGDSAQRNNGAYQVLRTCFSGALDGLACGSGASGPYEAGQLGTEEANCQANGGFFCAASADFIMTCCDPVASVSTGNAMCLTPNDCPYSWGASPGPNAGGAGAVDAGAPVYVGSLRLSVPAGASGTWTIGFNNNPNLTFMNDVNSGAIGIDMLIPGILNIPTGTCCSQQGPNIVCENDFTEADCSGEWNEGATCTGPTAPDPASSDDCTLCDPGTADPACDDGDACTDDFCAADGSGCTNTPNYDTANDCCNPSDGSLTPIDDGDDCTDDVCNADGSVDHPQAADGTSCDDNNPCTIDDACDAGLCGGDLVGEIACADDNDCPSVGQGCDVAAGLCICNVDTDLCVNPSPGQYDDVCCFDAGEKVDYTIQIGGGTVAVTGGQFLLSYDPSCMDFQSIGPCEGSIFDTEIEADVDEANGVIFYAIISDPMNPAGTTEAADLACLSFTKADNCDACEICIEDENPRHTILTSDTGNRVPINPCACSKPIRLAGDIDLDVPGDADVNADCDFRTADVTWDSASATDSCDGDLAVDCVSEHTTGADIDDLIANGGTHPQGVAFYACEATNSCGITEKKVWTVAVSDNQSLDVEVHLAPEMDAGVFTRAITFNLYENCTTAPTEECAEISFNGPYNFPGHGTASLKVDKGNYSCITAQDCLHTLRAAADINCVDGRYSAVFKGGAPTGNWLLGGNLDCFKEGVSAGDANCINILDFGMFMAEIAAGAGYANGNTDCSTEGPHGDINADGAVDNLDYGFILENFLECSKDLCCEDGAARDGDSLTTDISVIQLRKMGLGNLAVGDLNGDGRLNVDDMTAYMQGVMPVQNVREKRTSSR